MIRATSIPDFETVGDFAEARLPDAAAEILRRAIRRREAGQRDRGAEVETTEGTDQ